MKQTKQPHRLENTVIAVLDSEPEAKNAVGGLASAGYVYEVLSGEHGRRHLRKGEHGGMLAALIRAAEVIGDEYRVIDHLDDALQAGKVVVSVEAQGENATQATEILRRNGGHYVWKFGEWTFTNVGD
ncbi:MAG: hypothetical protein WCE80_05615 [Acidimicrobiia bacterium]